MADPNTGAARVGSAPPDSAVRRLAAAAEGGDGGGPYDPALPNGPRAGTPAVPGAEECSRRNGRSRALPAWALALPPLAVLGLVFLYPLALVAWQSVSPDGSGGSPSLAAYGDVFGQAAFRQALGTTVLIAVGSTAGAVILGFVLAIVIAFVPFPGGKALSRFIDVFLSFPSFLITLALLFIYGTVGMANGLWADTVGGTGPFDFLHTSWGVLLAEVTYFTPFVMRPLLAAFSQVETAQLEAAASLGAKAPRIVRQVILPEALPSLAAGGSLVLVMCLNEFGIVLFTGAKGVTTLPTLVYSKAILDGDYTSACVVAIVNIALSVGLYGLYRLLLSRTRPAGGPRARA
ncbi:2-aminoethylphosphonate ABC transporter permease subunit [Streptomyces sp. NPDC001262]|uniref:2-aminoethylphosphonate ABC transporter permease subunit n=1 Tax=unclassified Streptomyces TaxID=2593676 RepID=UPI0036C8CD02